MSQDLIPLTEEQPNWSPELDQFLSELARGVRGFNKPRKQSDRQRFILAMAEAFDIIGGVPRLALWADKNETEFYRLCGRTNQSVISQTNINANGPVTIVSPIGRSALDEEEPIEGESSEIKNLTGEE
jgi:hypothetical protein